jgi:hypothetical protein
MLRSDNLPVNFFATATENIMYGKMPLAVAEDSDSDSEQADNLNKQNVRNALPPQ